MAVVWERCCDGQLYEIRRAGNTIRLYRDGVLHTQYNPTRPLTLGVWDLLLLPALALPQAPRRVLVLGVGGGAVLRLLQDWFPEAELTGVELDSLHLDLARRFFGLDPARVALHQCEARAWLESVDPALGYDLVIDDLFVGSARDPVRAVSADRQWFELLLSRLHHGGALVLNFDSSRGLARAAWSYEVALRRRLPTALALGMPGYANAVGAFFGQAASASALRARITADPVLARELRSGRFAFSVRQLQEKR